VQGREPREGGPGRERYYLRYLSLGTQMCLLIVGGVFGGIWLDGRLGTEPAFTVAGSLVGIAVSMTVVIREVSRGN
jgi:F0F1-type ATP synthase assembly protein I